MKSLSAAEIARKRVDYRLARMGVTVSRKDRAYLILKEFYLILAEWAEKPRRFWS